MVQNNIRDEQAEGKFTTKPLRGRARISYMNLYKGKAPLRDASTCTRAGVAQLVERLSCKQRVEGSNPSASSFNLNQQTRRF